MADPEHNVSSAESGLYNTQIRHGFGVISEEWMMYLAQGFCNYFDDKRHETGAVPKSQSPPQTDWRSSDRQRTINAALVLCLNLGVDPPDVIKTQPCAKLEAWVNPAHITDSKKAIEQIGKNLQAQYESLSTRTKYKQCLDPNVEDMKRFCIGLRRSAREDRVLFHYNGHGVPRPTPSGEIWVFNRGYTQYIPVSVYELHSWLGSPVIYCFDCSGAGNILRNFEEFFARQAREEANSNADGDRIQMGSRKSRDDSGFNADDGCIQMGACRADEILPMHPQLPADMFTCCITSPVDIAVKWFVMQHNIEGLNPSSIAIPGKISDRRTPLGELNWIFTAITDTIAWSALDPALFKKLFRQDLVVAAMFRNFLLAVRLMRVYNCHPVSTPELPETHNHPMWASWDLAVHHYLLQLPALQKAESEGNVYEYEHSDFFEQQLTAFEVWLKYRSTDIDEPPEQLPILLQVLLSQIHRLRALLLLSRYLDLGPKAIRIALSISFFIYVQKLLQSPAPELKPVLVFIWTRLMAVYYKDIQTELIKDSGYNYFISILISPQNINDGDSNVNGFEYKAMCAFIIAQFCRGYTQGQHLCIQGPLFEALGHCIVEKESPLLRQWALLCLSQIWNNCPEGRAPIKAYPFIMENLMSRFEDPIPEVRAAAVLALSTYFTVGDEKLVEKINTIGMDGSPTVRREVVIFISKIVHLHLNSFLVCAFTTLEEEHHQHQSGDFRSESPAHGSIYLANWRILLCLSTDPFSPVRTLAQRLVDYVYRKLLKSPLAEEVKHMAYLVENHSPYANGEEKMGQPNGQVQGPSSGSGENPLEARKPSIVRHPSIAGSEFSSINGSITGNGSINGTNGANGSYLESAVSYARSMFGSPRQTPSIAASQRVYMREPEQAPIAPAVGEYDNGPHGEVRIPFKSSFHDWSIEYFTEPQLHSFAPDEPGSQKHMERLWRKQRNEGIMATTQVQKDLAVTGSWNNPKQVLKNSTRPTKLVFSQFENHLVALDHNNTVAVWDWKAGARRNQFNNGNPQGTTLNAARFVNEDDYPLLLTASNDGVARIYRHYDSPSEIELVTAWWFLSDLVPQHRYSPVCVDWHQSRGHLFVGGDTRIVRVWDAARESVTEDIPLGTASRLTSITSDQVTGNVFSAGFADGSVHVYDTRQPKQSTLITRYNEERSAVLNLRMQRGGARELMSGNSDGTVRFWDIRYSGPVLSFRAHTHDMRAVDIHEHAPVVATASRVIGLWSTSGRRVSTLRIPSATPKASAIESLAFHPHRITMAVDTTGDNNIHIFECTS